MGRDLTETVRVDTILDKGILATGYPSELSPLTRSLIQSEKEKDAAMGHRRGGAEESTRGERVRQHKAASTPFKVGAGASHRRSLTSPSPDTATASVLKRAASPARSLSSGLTTVSPSIVKGGSARRSVSPRMQGARQQRSGETSKGAARSPSGERKAAGSASPDHHVSGITKSDTTKNRFLSESSGSARDSVSPWLQKNMDKILDTTHAHAHNSHKVVLRAFLQHDTREHEMDDMIGVLKLQVGHGDAKDSSPGPEARTLLLAPEKVLHGNQSSKVASAKASMRASRSPSSRTFFIHAVDPSNAESWMLEVGPRHHN